MKQPKWPIWTILILGPLTPTYPLLIIFIVFVLYQITTFVRSESVLLMPGLGIQMSQRRILSTTTHYTTTRNRQHYDY